jgi:predicted nuclease of restriction endonuclease-like RecB superfamily
MRLALADIPKTFHRGAAQVSVTPRLLKPRSSMQMLTTLVGLYEGSLGLTRTDFPEDRPAEIAGDVRLARCLVACLSDWYQWVEPQWPQPATEAELAALAERGLESPSALRLALYDHINATYGGFALPDEREGALDEFASGMGLTRATLETLLALDAPAVARLKRIGDAPPTPLALAARYNQRATETLLMNAADVTWRLDPGDYPALGATVKRICFLARKLGVSYEISVASDMAASRAVAERREGYAAPQSLERAQTPILLTLHGPRELMGSANHYGERLARLCRALLGYRRGIPSEAALGDLAALGGVATLYLHGREVQFILDEKLARSLRLDTAEMASGASDALDFDSDLERRLHADFAALERAGETAGWRLEREPEPVILGDTILVPDFALTRENRRVYLEVAGYWRPDYRARKARKLAALRGVVALIVAAPEAARAEFVGLDTSYPFLWYRHETISATKLVATIERAYDDFPERLAALDMERLLAEIARRGMIPAAEATAALHCYTRAEVAQAVTALGSSAARRGAPGPEWIEGLGLFAAEELERLAEAARASVTAAGGRMPLSELAAKLGAQEQAIGEALALRAGLRVERASLFAAEVVAPEMAANPAAESDMRKSQAGRPTLARSRKAQPRPALRRTHSGAEWTAGELFPAEPEPGADEPMHGAASPPSHKNDGNDKNDPPRTRSSIRKISAAYREADND